jgi:hypothetical protein
MFARQLSIGISPSREAGSPRRRLSWAGLYAWIVWQWRSSAVIAARLEAVRNEQLRRYRGSYGQPWR